MAWTHVSLEFAHKSEGIFRRLLCCRCRPGRSTRRSDGRAISRSVFGRPRCGINIAVGALCLPACAVPLGWVIVVNNPVWSSLLVLSSGTALATVAILWLASGYSRVWNVLSDSLCRTLCQMYQCGPAGPLEYRALSVCQCTYHALPALLYVAALPMEPPAAHESGYQVVPLLPKLGHGRHHSR
jgi:hypothetical protein